MISKKSLALISSRQCKQCFFGISSNQFLNWLYTFYDWNSVDIISPDIYQKKNREVHVGWSKGISPFSFLALHQWNFLWSDYCVSTVCILCYLIPPSRSRGVPSLYRRETKRRHPKEEINKQYMNFYDHRKKSVI